MKAALFTALATVSLLVPPQGQAAEPPASAGSAEALRQELPSPSVDRKNAALLQQAPKKTAAKKRVYGGPLVAAVKTKKPFQLINPFAPRKYGDGTENLNYDPVTGQVRGVNLLTVEFK